MTPGPASIANMMVLTPLEAREKSSALAEILIACVHGGASVSFMAPLDRDKAESFWYSVAASVERGERILIAAEEPHTARIVGTVQILTQQVENQSHRADVAKMLVHPAARRRGIGAQLLQFAEDCACRAGKTLLVLDTTTGGDAERLYERSGWIQAGVIPDYALLPDGRPCSTTIFYKRLLPAL